MLKLTFSSNLDSQKLPLDPTVLATAMKGTAMGVPYKLPASTFMKEDPGTINACSRAMSELTCGQNHPVKEYMFAVTLLFAAVTQRHNLGV